MKIKEYVQGSITVFSSLVFLIVISIIFTLVDSARINSVDVKMNNISNIALESCFGQYVREVYEDYGLFMLNESPDKLVKNYEKYVKKNLSIDSTLRADYGSSEVMGFEDILDKGGENIVNQIYDYMKIKLPGDVITSIVEKCKSLNQSKNVNEYFEKMKECMEYCKKIDGIVDRVNDQINNINMVDKNIVILFEENIELLNQINKFDITLKNVTEDQKTSPENQKIYFEKKKLFEKLKEGHGNFSSSYRIINQGVNKISSQVEEYRECVSYAAGKFDEIEKYLQDNKDNMDKELFDSLNEKLESVRGQIADAKKDAYGMFACGETNNEYLIIINNSNKQIISFFEYMDIVVENDADISDIEKENNNFYIEYISSLEDAKNDISRCDFSKLKLNYSKREVEKEENSVIDFIDGLSRNGILGIVAPGGVSDKKLKGENIPSKMINGEPEKRCSNQKEIILKALVGQYILDNFVSYVDKKGEDIEYEIEYILDGNACDKDNLNTVVNQITAIREGLNLVHIFQSNEKMEQANILATTLVGFTGIPVLITITQLVIIGVWAYAESIVDVKDLLDGYAVKTLKSDSDWNLSLEGIWNIENANGKKGEEGLKYKDYLRGLLFFGDVYNQAGRIADVIEFKIRNKYNDGFVLGDCLVNVEIESTYQINRFFSLFSFVYDVINDKRRSYTVKKIVSFSYC